MGKPRDSTQLRVVESRGYEESGRLGKKWCRGREKRSLDLRGGWSRLIRSITQAPDPERTYFLRRPPESARGFDFLAVALSTALRAQDGSAFFFTSYSSSSFPRSRRSRTSRAPSRRFSRTIRRFSSVAFCCLSWLAMGIPPAENYTTFKK